MTSALSHTTATTPAVNSRHAAPSRRAVLAWLAWSWGFTVAIVLVLIGLALNIVIQIQLLRDPKSSISFMKGTVEDGFGNAIGKSEVQEHNAFLRYQVANNILFLLNNLIVAGMIGAKYM